MARKKGIVSGLKKYGNNHPYVTLALAGTFSYYLYENIMKAQPVAPLTDAQKKEAFQQSIRDYEKSKTTYQYDDQIIRDQMKMAGLGASTSTTSSTSSSHRMPGPGDGETSMNIDHTKSGLFGIGAAKNPPSHLMFDKAQGLGACHKCGTRNNPHCHCGGSHGVNGFSPSARRRVGHAGIGMASESYKATLDTQFENREAMMMGDLKKHQDILGFSGLAPLAGGDWYE